DVAHRAGIVHRDLKPGNVMLTTAAARPGQPHAKLLDFGLAKSARATGLPGAGGPAIELAALSAPVTMTSPLTTQGTIVGTVQYMAPEQLEGKEADVRSDVFAFGAVAYEMLTGERAFPGKTLVSLMASILEHEPRLPSSGPAAVPSALARVVQKCLAKDPNRRWQSAGDLADELRWIGDEGALKPDAPNGDAVTTTKTVASQHDRNRHRSACGWHCAHDRDDVDHRAALGATHTAAGALHHHAGARSPAGSSGTRPRHRHNARRQNHRVSRWKRRSGRTGNGNRSGCASAGRARDKNTRGGDRREEPVHLARRTLGRLLFWRRAEKNIDIGGTGPD